jgi:hypothetical protein
MELDYYREYAEIEDAHCYTQRELGVSLICLAERAA